MSTVIQSRGETGGATHLRCPTCGQLSNSHVTQLSHVANAHPTCLDDLTFGRLGNIIMYQSGAKLFHCAACFYTCRDFSTLYRHLISTHCMDQSAGSAADTVKTEDEGGVDEGSAEKECGAEVDDITDTAEKMGGKLEEAAQTLQVEEGRANALEESNTGDECLLKVDPVIDPQHEGDMSGVKKEAEGETITMWEDEGGINRGEETTKRKHSETDESGESERPAKGGLLWSKGRYHCLLCGWKNKLKAASVSHMVRKHNIPKAFASQVVKRDEEDNEESTALSGELLKEEMAAVSRVVSILPQHFVCKICGWTTKRKGLAVSHVDRSHEVERPYRCKECPLAFFLPSRLQQHMSSAHRPGCYACPFCCFRSHYLGGFKRHCSRCNIREEEGPDGAVAGVVEEVEETEVKEIRAGGRVRRAKVMAGEEEGDEVTRDGLS